MEREETLGFFVEVPQMGAHGLIWAMSAAILEPGAGADAC